MTELTYFSRWFKINFDLWLKKQLTTDIQCNRLPLYDFVSWVNVVGLQRNALAASVVNKQVASAKTKLVVRGDGHGPAQDGLAGNAEDQLLGGNLDHCQGAVAYSEKARDCLVQAATTQQQHGVWGRTRCHIWGEPRNLLYVMNNVWRKTYGQIEHWSLDKHCGIKRNCGKSGRSK